jgi:hypothetical protein
MIATLICGGAVVFVFTVLLILGLCRAAADADDQMGLR